MGVGGIRAEALARLDGFVGEWTMEAVFPGGTPAPPGAAGERPVARSWFEWTLDRQFLVQRTEVRAPGAPDALMIVGADPESGAYTQHYYDSCGVTRLYAMTFAGGAWTLARESPDFSALEFAQRFTATFSADGGTISGAWEKKPDGAWEHDFALTYRRTG